MVKDGFTVNANMVCQVEKELERRRADAADAVEFALRFLAYVI